MTKGDGENHPGGGWKQVTGSGLPDSPSEGGFGNGWKKYSGGPAEWPPPLEDMCLFLSGS